MRIIKQIFLISLLYLSANPNLFAQDEFSPGVGIALKTSTNGFGADVAYNFHNRMILRLGYEKLGVKTNFTFEEESVKYAADVKYKTGSISLLFDYYLSNHVFVTVGAGWNQFQAVVDGEPESYLQFGDIQIQKEKIGLFSFRIDPSLEISPYAGIGFGRTLGLKKKIGFAFELGGFYQGPPQISITSTGLLSPTSNPDQQHEARLEKQINQYSIYPVLKLSLSYKIVGL